MPTYEYLCNKCGEHFEVFQSFSEDPLKKHPGCGGKVVKVLSPAGIVFSGSGFYKTDNRSSGSRRSTSGDSKSGDSKSGDSKSGESKSGESKSGESTSSASSSSSGSESKKSA